MRNVIVSNMISLDGYYEGKDRDIVSLFDYWPSEYSGDQTFDTYGTDLLRCSGTLLLAGRTSFMGNMGYWTSVPNDPNASAPDREIAARIADGIPIVVVSDSLTAADTGPWVDQVTIVSRDGAADAVAALRAADGDTVLFGSRRVWTQLIRDGLVDELYLMIGPKLVAGDDPAFAGVPPTQLRLLDVIRSDGSEAVTLHYQVLA